MSQFIVLGTNDKNYNISNNPISGLQEDSLLFAKNGYISGIAPPTYENNILQWDPNTQEFQWNTLTLSTLIGNNETSKGILWNDASDYLHMMSAETGVYQIKIENDVYTLVPANDGNVFIGDGVTVNSILLKSPINNMITGITPNVGYLYYNDQSEYVFHNPVKTASNDGLIYWNGSSYTGVKGVTDGLYALTKNGSSMVNITNANGFIIASDKKAVSLQYPVSSGEYMLLVNNNGKLGWKKNELIRNKVINTVISTAITDGAKLCTFAYSGDYMLTFDFVAEVDMVALSMRSNNFQEYLDSCPTLEVVDSGGKTLLKKIFTGSLPYDYFTFSVIDTFSANSAIFAKWRNNENNIVKIVNTNITANYIEMEKDNYKELSGTDDGILDTFDSSSTINISFDMSYEVDLLNTPSNSCIVFDVGSQKTFIRALPPVAYQYYSLSKVYNVLAGDTISLTVNNNYVKIKNYNIIVNNLQ